MVTRSEILNLNVEKWLKSPKSKKALNIFISLSHFEINRCSMFVNTHFAQYTIIIQIWNNIMNTSVEFYFFIDITLRNLVRIGVLCPGNNSFDFIFTKIFSFLYLNLLICLSLFDKGLKLFKRAGTNLEVNWIRDFIYSIRVLFVHEYQQVNKFFRSLFDIHFFYYF